MKWSMVVDPTEVTQLPSAFSVGRVLSGLESITRTVARKGRPGFWLEGA